MKYPSVYIVVLNWNHLDDLILTMESLLEQDYPNMQILISDNGSTDDSQKHIKKSYPDVILLENKNNLGWAAGNNVGIKYALNNDADYILLANNDISIEYTSIISTLVSDLEKLKKYNIALIGTKVNYFSEKERTHSTGWKMYPKEEVKGSYFNEYRKNCNIEFDGNYEIVDSPDGCFFFLK